MKTLLVRADGLGDALVCAPLVAALRGAGHELGIVLGARNREAFASGAFAHVHVLERIPWPAHGSTPRSREVALRDVRALRYDIALVASEELDAYAFARDANIGTRVGFINGWEKPLKSLQVRPLLTRPIVRAASALRAREHEVVTVFRLGMGLHGESQPTRDVGRLRALVLGADVAPHGRVVLQVSRKYAALGLDAAAYVALARELGWRELHVLAVGDDEALVARVAEAAGIAGEGALTVTDWKARIAGARALVTPDSGAAHVAGMLGVPVVDCFAPHPAVRRDIVRWQPWASHARARILNPVHDAEALAERLARDVAALVSWPNRMAV